ncbi:hypothetical protein [Pseudomonas linyingensis]|nr:hypothetical protein [Pseudomonas linyingensis]
MPLLIPPPGHRIGSAAFLALVFLLIALIQFLLIINGNTLGIAAFISNTFTSPYAMVNLFSNMKPVHGQPTLGLALIFAHYPIIGFAWGFISPMHANTTTQVTLFALKRLAIILLALTTPGLVLSLAFV